MEEEWLKNGGKNLLNGSGKTITNNYAKTGKN